MFARRQMESIHGRHNHGRRRRADSSTMRACPALPGPARSPRLKPARFPRPGRTITVTVRNWSDTVTFLVEAEVTRSMPSDAIRQAYPAIYGRSMSFTLPATAEGPSMEADLGGSEIVFPLGPALQLIVGRLHSAGGRGSNQAVSLRAEAGIPVPIIQRARLLLSSTGPARGP